MTIVGIRTVFCVSCAVLDAGFSATHAVPIYGSSALNFGIKRLNLGGKALTNHLKQVCGSSDQPPPLRERQLMLSTPRQRQAAAQFAALVAWLPAQRQRIDATRVVPPQIISFRSYNVMEETYLINDVKERLCYVRCSIPTAPPQRHPLSSALLPPARIRTATPTSPPPHPES